MWKRASAVIAAVGVALLPKCPACWSIYAGLSSALGVNFVLERAWLLPLTLASLALALASLASMARRTGRYLPLAIASLSAIAVWAGKFVLQSELCTWIGLIALVGASFGARHRGARSASSGATRAGSELSEHAEAR